MSKLQILTASRFIIFQLLLISLGYKQLLAQPAFYYQYEFSSQDSLRGTLNAARSCFDVGHYNLALEVNPQEKSIKGSNTITFRATTNFNRLQLDLFENMKIDGVYSDLGRKLNYRRVGNAFFVEVGMINEGDIRSIRVDYRGNPIIADNAPWDGGFVWDREAGNDWIGVACEGTGASLWWPNKDHLSDEPDSMDLFITCPKSLYANSNGNLIERKDVAKNKSEFHWKVNYPINNYNVTLNIGVYKHFSDVYVAADGDSLELDYYVLPKNYDKAVEHFKQVKPMLACYEAYFGKYPFWEDGFALVETPYLGMEHQSAIAYGNNYERGYLGGMIPRDMDWDYIIIHETGHEYFGNSISAGDHAEMWIHESFTTYMEALYVECMMGYDDAIRYLNHFRNRLYIKNEQPIIGPLGVNWDDWDSSDHYFKGSWVLHTLRNAIGDDELWFDLLKSFYQKFKNSVIKSEDFFAYVNEKTGEDFSAFFNQYFKYADVPTLEYKLNSEGSTPTVSYRWVTDVENFEMETIMGSPGSYQRLAVTNEWQTKEWPGLDENTFRVRRELFLIRLLKR